MWRLLRAVLALIALLTPLAGATAQPAMWTLSDEDTVIYLFGTIHTLPTELHWRTPEFDAAFEAADTFCVETDVVAKGLEILRLTLSEGVFSGEERLRDHMSRKQTRELHEFARAVGIVPESIEVQKPWQALMTLSAALSAKLGLDEASGVELSLLPTARADGKAICEMETPEAHIYALSKLPLNVQIAALTHEDEDFDTAEEALEYLKIEMEQLIRDWSSGDVEAIGAYDIEDYGHPDFYEAIIVKRNQNWIPRIENLLEEPGTKFIAVGAAHLAGPDSVVIMLREKGYTVEGP